MGFHLHGAPPDGPAGFPSLPSGQQCSRLPPPQGPTPGQVEPKVTWIQQRRQEALRASHTGKAKTAFSGTTLNSRPQA